MQTEERKKHVNVKKLLKVILKPSNLIILALLLSVNTYAWFIYISKVSTSIDAHVSSWKISLDGEELSKIITLNIDDMLPGMADYNDSFEIENDSEVTATVSYQILSYTYAGEKKYTKEGRAEAGEAADASDISSDDMITALATEQPFKITMSVGATSLSAAGGTTNFNLNVTWPFESGDDARDTEYGIKAAKYKETNPGSPTLEMQIKVIITQH